jgi:hypothetical protein
MAKLEDLIIRANVAHIFEQAMVNSRDFLAL